MLGTGLCRGAGCRLSRYRKDRMVTAGHCGWKLRPTEAEPQPSNFQSGDLEPMEGDMVSVHTHSHIHPLAHVNTHLCTHRQPSGNSKASSQNSQPEYLKDKQRRGLGQPRTYTLAARAGLEGGRVGSHFQGGARPLPGLRSPTCSPV